MSNPAPINSASNLAAEPRTLRKSYISVPSIRRPNRIYRLGRVLTGVALSPLYWILARLYGGPGLEFRSRCALMGLRLLFTRKGPLSRSDFFRLLFWPIDSVRYFEFDFMWAALSRLQPSSYLDISSPRMFPLIFLGEHPDITAELVNPDKADLEMTRKFITACGLDPQCRLGSLLIEDFPFAHESFDAVTSISVVEHIHEDKTAIENIWRLVKPGGRLLLSVPCAAVAEEEYMDTDFYGVQTASENEFLFHQYKYDQNLLEERIYCVTGYPRRSAIYGEKIAGTLQSWLTKQWTREIYPIWKEPYAVAREFQYYESLADLPGDGVIAMEFVKPGP